MSERVKVIKVEAWKDDAGVVHATRQKAMNANAIRALGLIGIGTHCRLSTGTIDEIMSNSRQIWAILQELNADEEVDNGA